MINLKISILGSGSWGSALGNVLAKNNHEVLIWGREVDEVNDINQNHENSKYFKEVKLDSGLVATNDFNHIKNSDVILIAVPSIAIEEVCFRINDVIDKPAIIVNVAKGFHPVSHLRISEVIKNAIDKDLLVDVVSLIGPTHAEEVVLNLLTAINAVCENDDSAKVIQEIFSNDTFRVYRSNDVVGSEIGVALKNVMAIASGIVEGLKQGDNAKAALMTRGLAEISRFGQYFGAKPETYLGLTGVGDLIVTCTSHHSRNFMAGYEIGKANSATDFMLNNKKTVEGIFCAKIVYELAIEHNIQMPITNQVYEVLFQNKMPSLAIFELMQRELKAE